MAISFEKKLDCIVYLSRPTTACSRRCYRAAPAKALVILASLARIRVFDTRNAAEANRWAEQ